MLNLFLYLSITFKMIDVGYPSHSNKETIRLMSVFINELFDENKYAPCNKQVIKPCFQEKGANAVKI